MEIIDTGVVVRTARPDDAVALLTIYCPYVEETAITFEYDVPTEAEFRRRIESVLLRYPYLVAEAADGRPLGYAYAGAFQERRAYDWAVETSIYIRRDVRGRGLGRLLHDALRTRLQSQGVQNMCACITSPSGEDPYVTTQSIDFHAHLGYRLVGTFEKIGYKFGRWYNMAWMELHIGPHPVPAPPRS